MKRLRSRDALLRILSWAVSLGLLASTANAADITTIATTYQPTINETIDASGFKHPGVGLTKDVLENMRTQVRAQKEPWNTYFNQMLLSGAASTTPTIKNVNGSDPSKPRYYGLNSQGVESLFVTDALTAYTQAILYYVTGNETYRANALRIIRLYSQMDPSQFAYYTDAHIHTGIPLQRMVGAAEILRYTSYQSASLAWTEDDTNNFVNNFMLPTIYTDDSSNDHFMNQHLYTTIGAMSGWIFTGNRARYDEAVEWFTVNKTAADQGQNGAIKALFRLVTRNDLTGEEVTPAVQHVEMGRDQAHGAGDITNAQILARFMMAQGTKVDPVEGTPSTAPEAVGPYEFLGDRILQAAELFGTFMQGYEIPWIPTASHTDAYGTPTVVYRDVADSYRGRLTQNTWELFYYYTYVRNANMAQIAPNFTRIFANRTIYNWDGGDGGGDFWIFIPAAAASEGSKYLVKTITNPYREVETRFTPLDGNSAVKTDATASYIETTATAEGSKFAVYGYGYGTSDLAFKVRTNGIATMQAFGTSIQLPNTNGQWMYVHYAGSLGDFLPVTIVGAGTTVDIDHINVNGSTLSQATFTGGNADLDLYTYAGASQAVTANFGATDSSASATLSYRIDNPPPGASFNASTGAFSWQPTQAGTYTFVISVWDGTSVTSKRATVVVGTDRQATINAVIASYNASLPYVSSTLATYLAAYNDIESVVASASDEVFFQKLATLRSAVAGLQQMSPVIGDGSLNYKNMLASSTFGSQVPNALDNTPDSFVGYYLAQNQTHTLDFGPSFKVAPTAFGLQVRTSFPERIGGTTVYGSNDNSTWTRLTPAMTVVTEDMQVLQVESDLQNQRYRFFKIAMIEPSSSMLELGEFHIFGTRYETVNQLSSVTMSSDQALRNRIVPGNTVKLKFVSTAPINNVVVTIQGQPATVTTTDNVNWTASWVANTAAPYGKVSFTLNYKTAAGVDAEPTFFTTDGSSLSVADLTGLIGDVTTIAAVTDSSGRNAADAIATANLLFDSNIASATDYRVNGSGYGGWVEFDFRGGGTVELARVEVLARQDQVGRINGTVVQGSNDNTSWTTITNAAGNNADWQTLTASSNTPYRYLRIYNGGNWYGNMAEVRLYGVAKSSAQIATASITSAQSLSPSTVLNKRVVAGNTVTLKFSAKAPINNASVTIQGQAATVGTTDNINFTATAILPPDAAPGSVAFSINYQQQDGSAGFPSNATTDGSGLYVVDESDVIRNISTIATLIDSSQASYHTAAGTKAAVDALFDSNAGTFSDFRIGSTNSCVGSYIVFDFKSGNQVNLTSVEMLARQDQTLRAKGVVFQGSNDGAAWTNLTSGGAQTQDWQNLAVASAVPYRYIRIFNGNSWCGNLAEVRLHGSLHGADTTAPVTQADVPGVTVGQDTTITLTATDVGSGVQATYFTIDGGAQQSGASIRLPADGPHTLAYWSVDWAGNVESKHTATVSLDKTPPVIAGLYADVTAPTNQNVTVTIYYPTDAVVREYKLGDNGAWTAYSAPVVVTGNTVVYARSADAAANVSAIASLTVGNINKVPPSGASFTASITDPTQGAVTVSITYPDNVVLRQYRIGDSGAWATYAGPLTVTDNATVYAQSVDSVGNVSPVTSYAVTNIDRVAPADAQFAADITIPTNKDVTVTIVFPGDAATREYKLGEDGAWAAYGAPVLMSNNGVLFARAADAAGNLSNVMQYAVANIDRIPPVNAVLTVDTTAPTNQGVTVTITYPEDAAVREYMSGGGEWMPYTAAIHVASDTTVYARASDAVGNMSNVASIVVNNIFKEVPITNVALSPASPNGRNTWYTTDVSVTLAVSPGAYGGALTTEYQVNGGAWAVSTGDAIAFSEGSYTLGYRTRDQAGNVEQVKTIEFKVDKTLPALSVALDKSEIWPPNHLMVPINAVLTAADGGSGLESVVLTNITSNKPDSGKGDVLAEFGTPATTFSVRAERDRVYTVTYTATDKAGNVTQKSATVTVPRDQASN